MDTAGSVTFSTFSLEEGMAGCKKAAGLINCLSHGRQNKTSYV
jgi:hypothetical protein